MSELEELENVRMYDLKVGDRYFPVPYGDHLVYEHTRVDATRFEVQGRIHEFDFRNSWPVKRIVRK